MTQNQQTILMTQSIVSSNGQSVGTQQATPLTPVSNTAPAVVLAANELSGAQWVSRFPTSSQLSDCASPFRENLTAFVGALRVAGAAVSISATFRPPERAYLMHWCWSIVKAEADPRNIPPMDGVNILWAHADATGSYSSTNSINAARAMVNGYGMQNLQVAPSLNSRHTQGLAVDMSICWSGSIAVLDNSQNIVEIHSTPRDGMNPALHVVGATYGVIKYVGGMADKPHWSSDGH